MGFGRTLLHDHNGRMSGSFCYMILCEVSGFIYIKIGHSSDPFRRLTEIRTGCPLEPKICAYCHVFSKDMAVSIERELHAELKAWRSRGEWFVFPAVDKEQFNTGWKKVFARHAAKSWPLRWQKASARQLQRLSNQRRAWAQNRFRERGFAYQDFAKHCN